MLDAKAAPTPELDPLPGGAPLPLKPDQLAFRAAFAAAYASTGDAPGSVRAALERCGGSDKARRRPSEVARRLLMQEPVRRRIAELGGVPPPSPALAMPLPAPAVAVVPPLPVDPPPAAAEPIAPETAAKLVAVAFDPAMPPGVSRAAIAALRAALVARSAELEWGP